MLPITCVCRCARTDQVSRSRYGGTRAVVQNVAPTAVNDIYTHIDGGDLVVDAAHGVLANDLDPGTDTLSAFDYSVPSVGTLVGNEDGSFTFTPPERGFLGDRAVHLQDAGQRRGRVHLGGHGDDRRFVVVGHHGIRARQTGERRGGRLARRDAHVDGGHQQGSRERSRRSLVTMGRIGLAGCARARIP